MAAGKSDHNNINDRSTECGVEKIHAPIKTKRRKGVGFGGDGKPIAPVILAALFVVLMFVAIYFGTVEGWFGGASDPASVDATVPPEYTPQPELNTAQPISALNDKTLTILVIDVGQGCCSLLMSPNGKTMLIDSGDSEHYADVRAALASRGVEKLDAVVATAAEAGHIGAMELLVEDYPIGTFYICPSIVDSGGFAELIGALEEMQIETRQVWAGNSNVIQWDKSCTIDVLAPIYGREDAEEYSGCIALRVSHSGHSVLFASELDFAAEEMVIENSAAERIKCSVLCVASYGADGSTGQEFLNAADPSCAVISVGSGNKGFPANAVLARLNAKGINVLRTDKSGTVSIIIDKDGIKVK